MKGIIVQFRRGRKVIHERHYLLELGLNSREEAKKYVGKEVEWTSSGGKIIKGKILSIIKQVSNLSPNYNALRRFHLL